MNVLFLTIGCFDRINAHSIYPDLLRCFRDSGHSVYIVSARERRNSLPTEYVEDNDVYELKVKIGNITKCGLLEKGISTILIESKFLSAIKKYLSDTKFDLVIYTTPPITFARVVQYIKKRDNARTYLLLKDIFPQNSVDLEMMSKTGPKSIIYKCFRKKEKQLYAISDRIGCMSQANVDYVINHNPEVDPDKVEVCPNSIEVQDMRIDTEKKSVMRNKYGIPEDKTVFVYGGNLGKPQGIPFIIECLKTQENNDKVYFLFVGDGTEYGKLEAYIHEASPTNMKLMKRLPKEDYDWFITACDIGLIFLDHRFTIPNFPSRLLSYMQAKLPVLACTDPNTDIGKVIVDGGFGWWCESNSVESFTRTVDEACRTDPPALGSVGYTYLTINYSVEQSYETIMEKLK